ncbi:MAG: DUF2334 domain-containing protein [Pirellulales bacterium]
MALRDVSDERRYAGGFGSLTYKLLCREPMALSTVTERPAGPSSIVPRWREQSRSSLYVCIHDVAPVFLDQLSELCAALRPLLGSEMAAAVVPRWGGKTITRDDAEFVQLVTDNCDELLLHGLTHQNTEHRGLVARFTGDADELRRLSGEECEQRVAEGQAILWDVLAKRAVGFAPPAWQQGKVTSQMLNRHGLLFCVGLQNVSTVEEIRLPTATWSWDLGVVPGAGYVGEACGGLAHRIRKRALPVVVVHPHDVVRGYLPRIVRVIQALLDSGRRPVLLSQLLAGNGRPVS